MTGTSVRLAWRTATEVNNYGFSIERSTSERDGYAPVGFVTGNGTSNVPHSYSFIDDHPPVGEETFYRLKQIDRDGSLEYSPVLRITRAAAAEEFEIHQNAPNPFRTITEIGYATRGAQPVALSLRVYDVHGRLVATLKENELHEPGQYRVRFDGTVLAAGTYHCVLTGGGRTVTRAMTVVK